MADENANPTNPATPEAPIVPPPALAFFRRFENVALLAVTTAGKQYTRWWRVLKYEGAPDDLVRYGLLSPSLVPQGRKRIADDYSSETTMTTSVRKVRGGRLQVRLRIEESDLLPEGHPLAPFNVRDCHLLKAPDLRAAREHVEHTVDWVDTTLAIAMRSLVESAHGYHVSASEVAELRDVVSRFRGEYAARVRRLRLTRSGRPELRIVGATEHAE